MEKLLKVELLGDSILKGIQVNPINKRYCVDNHMELDELSKKYAMEIENCSSFGCTVTKGSKQLQKLLDKNIKYNVVIMDFGGNDCDYNWSEIAKNPEGEHLPNTPIDVFIKTYCDMINKLKEKGIQPILTTLPPLNPENFFNWFCGSLDKVNILKWLGDINRIYLHQETYSKAVEDIAKKMQVPLIDIRKAFLNYGDTKELLCEDGTHPNTIGQKIISSTLSDFAGKMVTSNIL